MDTNFIITKIDAILKDKDLDLDLENCEETKCQLIENLIPQYGWKVIQESMINILLDGKRQIIDYVTIAEVFWGAVLDKREICVNKVIALLYHRLHAMPDENISNLIWSIVCKLKRIDYLSDYKPLNDKEIINELLITTATD